MSTFHLKSGSLDFSCLKFSLKRIICCFFVVVFLFSTSVQAFADNGPDTWVGDSSVNLGGFNWTGTNNPPLSGDSWIFGTAGSSGTTLNNDLNSFSVAGITFDSGADAFTINGNSLTLTGDIANNGNNTETFGMDIAGAITNSGTGLGSTVITGGVDSSVAAITENSTSSALTISTGALSVNSSGTTLTNSNSSGSSLLTVSGGVTGTGNLILKNNSAIDGGITLSTTGVDNSGAITNSGTGSGSTIISADIGPDVTDVIQDSATSTLILSGNNTYSGVTTLTAGTLNLGSINAISSGTINFNGGILQYSASNTTDYSGQFSNAADQAYNIDTNGQDVTFANALTSSGGSLTKMGGGTLTLDAANTYSGATAINAGTLQLAVVGAISDTSDVSIASGAILDMDGNSQAIGSLAGAGTVTSSAAGGVNLMTGGDNSSTTFSGNIQDGSGTVGLSKEGSGTLVLTGNNTYSGDTALDAGTLNLGSSNAIGPGTIDFNGGTLQYSTSNNTDYSGQFSTAASQAYNIDTNGQDVTFATDLTSSGGTLAKIGNGTLTLAGNNTYDGGTDLIGGTLNLGSANPIGTGTVSFDGGILQYSGSNNNDYSGQFSTAASQAYNIDTNGQDVIFGTSLSSVGGSLAKIGNGTLTLLAANTYTGATTISGGTLQLAVPGAISDASDVSVASGATLDLDGNSQTIGSLAGAGTVTSSAGGSMALTAGDTSSTTFSGTIQDGSGAGSGTINLITAGTGSLTLNGANAFSGGTEVVSGSTLQVGNANALGTGPVTNEGTLNIGATNLSIGGMYTQSTGSTLDLALNSGSTFGKITSVVAASVAAGSSINVTVGYNVPNKTIFDIIDTGGAGVGAVPATITSTSSIISFSSSILNNDLVLTAFNSGLTPLADNANARAIGTVLDHMSNPSSDMSNVLGKLVNLSNAQITSSLNTMGPIIDRGVMENSSAALNNFIGASLDRIHIVLSRNDIINGSLDKAEKTLSSSGFENPADAGLSSGDEDGSQGIWAKPYGSYLNQGTRQNIQGYDAWNAGTVVGIDRLMSDNFTIGMSGGYAYGRVNSDANDADTDINSAQGTIYAGYQDPNFNYFINAAGSFAWNWYDGQRDISVGTINRTADSSYDGQQYSTYLDGGYKFNLGANTIFTPLASLQWTHLSINSYTETNAGSLDLKVENQDYDTLVSGLGASLSYPEKYDWGIFTPEFHAKWLYDYIGDKMVVTSSFTGGGGSFTSNGASPARSGADIGGKLSFDINNDVSLIAEADAELKDGFIGVYGSGTVNYKF